MKDIIGNLFGFLYTLSMGDYIFFSLTFILILTFLYLIFLIKSEDEVLSTEQEKNELESIVNKIETEYKPSAVTLTEYETEQERNAIISYEELIKNKEKLNVSYDEDYVSEDDTISIKKISLSETNCKEEIKSELNVKLMSYDKEEAFLVALKQLQKNLL